MVGFDKAARYIEDVRRSEVTKMLCIGNQNNAAECCCKSCKAREEVLETVFLLVTRA